MTWNAVPERRLLVIEDDYFWADELRRALEDAGATVLGPVASVETAMALLRSEPELDAAILDLGLRGVQAYGVADWLLARRVPILVITGYEAEALPPAYAALLRLEKPVSTAAVLTAVETLFPIP
ncbi:response regulator [Methylorubrum populi]|uniref:Response regulator n=1 Tax=Methylobacterium radiotolerans TaxID=31998 RepID=A0ABU7TEC5_9HYPH|nr:response regulator [Methylobacterium sp. B4]PXW66878.1 CheY-like chemotaxis protein [Methylobacterium sp. B4]